jgi:hypothetical protein
MIESSRTSPHLLVAGWSIVKALVTIRGPGPFGEVSADHSRLASVLGFLAGDVLGRLRDVTDELDGYIAEMEGIDPDRLSREEALAYWLNVYNAAGLRLGGAASRKGVETVFGVPGAFTRPVVAVKGVHLSLDEIEHAKVRRFRDPRIHAGLVCGAMSCPTLRREPYTGHVDSQLDDQMRQFLRSGALVAKPAEETVVLSPIFAWFGRDFVMAERMPTLLPARRRAVLEAVVRWADDETREWVSHTSPSVRFSTYDWRLGCDIG